MRIIFAHELDEPAKKLVAGIEKERKDLSYYLSMNLSYSSPVTRFSGQPWYKY